MLLMLNRGHAQPPQVIALGFPACVAVPKDAASCWLVGGHTLAQLDLKTHRIVDRYDWPQRNFSSSAGNYGDLVLGGTSDIEMGCLGVWDSSKQSRFRWIHDDLPFPITCVATVGDRVIAGNDQGEVAAFELESGKEIWKQQMHSKMVTSAVAVPGVLCVTADWIGKLVVFDSLDGQPQSDFQQHRDRVSNLVSGLAEPTPQVISGSRDGTVRLWYPTQGRLVRFVQMGEPITALENSGGGSVIAATRDAKLSRIDMQTAQVVSSQASNLEYVSYLLAVDGQTVLALDGKGSASLIAVE